MQDIPMPVDFRNEIIKPLLKALGAGESCSLVGVGSSGKSNVIRHLLRQDVREHFLGEPAQGILLLYVDCTKLLDYTMRALHGLILEAMLRATEKVGTELAALHPKLERLWEQATDSESPDRTRRALEEAVARVLQAGATQIYVILDDFDHVVQKASAPVLNSLRSLRDNHKYRVVYVTVTRREMAFLRDENEYQDFHELVSSTTIPIGPYSEVDANLMIDRLSLRWNLRQKLNEIERQRLLEVSGRHAGLLSAILRATQRDEPILLTSPDLLEELRGHRDIEPECIKIWESLEQNEIDDLLALVRRGWPIGNGVHQLERKGLIWRRLDGAYDIFSPVFADFVRSALPEGHISIELVPERHEVWIEGRKINSLERIEYQLFACLYHHRGQTVSRQELIKEMIRAETGGRVSDRPTGPPERRLESYMSEVKLKIGTGKRDFIFREPGGDYRLVGPDEK